MKAIVYECTRCKKSFALFDDYASYCVSRGYQSLKVIQERRNLSLMCNSLQMIIKE